MLTRKQKVIRMITLIAGIAFLAISGMKLLMTLPKMFFGGELDLFDLNYFSWTFLFLPGLILLLGSKKIGKLEFARANKFYAVAATIMLIYLLFPIIVAFYKEDFLTDIIFGLTSTIIECIQLLLYPVFYFIFIRKNLIS